MSDLKDFVIENGVLSEYHGAGGDVVIPEGVTVIDQWAFAENETITSVVIPNSVTRIGTQAFYRSSIESVTLPTSVKIFGARCFGECHKLTTIIVPENGRIPGSIFDECRHFLDERGRLIIHRILYQHPRVFDQDMIVPDGVVEIADRIGESSEVNTLYLPNSITCISKEAFRGMHIHRIVASDAVFLMAWDALDSKQRFEICSAMIKANEEITGAVLKYCIKSDKILDYVVKLDRDALLAVLLDAKKTMPLDKLEKAIENSAKSPKVRAVLLDYRNKHYTQEKVEEIKQAEIDQALDNSAETDWKWIFTLKPYEKKGWIVTSYRGEDIHVVVPETVDGKPILAIGEKAFSPQQRQSAAVKKTRKQMVSIKIPNSVSVIEHMAFSGCESLTELHLPSGLKKIINSACWWCSDTLTIHAPAGSYAETYAKKNNIPFVAE